MYLSPRTSPKYNSVWRPVPGKGKEGEKVSAETQLNVLINNQRSLIEQEKDAVEKAKLIGFAAGFLNGMRLTNCVTAEQYNKAYAAIVESNNGE